MHLRFEHCIYLSLRYFTLPSLLWASKISTAHSHLFFFSFFFFFPSFPFLFFTILFFFWGLFVYPRGLVVDVTYSCYARGCLCCAMLQCCRHRSVALVSLVSSLSSSLPSSLVSLRKSRGKMLGRQRVWVCDNPTESQAPLIDEWLGCPGGMSGSPNDDLRRGCPDNMSSMKRPNKTEEGAPPAPAMKEIAFHFVDLCSTITSRV
jgi:hypothetical protein